MREWRIESLDEDVAPSASPASDLRALLRLGLAAVLIVAASIPNVSHIAGPTAGHIVLGQRHVEQPSPPPPPPPPPQDRIMITRDTVTTCTRTGNPSYRVGARIPVIPDLRTRCLTKARKSTEVRVTTLAEMHPTKVWSAGLVPLRTDSPGRVFVILDPTTGQVLAYIRPGD